MFIKTNCKSVKSLQILSHFRCAEVETFIDEVIDLNQSYIKYLETHNAFVNG